MKEWYFKHDRGARVPRGAGEATVIDVEPSRLMPDGTGPRVVGITDDAPADVKGEWLAGRWVVKAKGAWRKRAI